MSMMADYRTILSKYKNTIARVLVVVLLSVLLAFLTHHQPLYPMVPGIDSSWVYALNYIQQHGLIMGRDIYFTFGPLGFLERIRGLEIVTVYYTAIFWFCVSLIANAFVCLLCLQSGRSWPMQLLNLVIGCTLIVFLNTSTPRLLMILYAGIFLHWHSQHVLYLLILSLATILCLLIKFSYGIVALALLLPYLCIVVIQHKKYRAPAIAIFALPLCYSVLWYIIYHTMAGSLGYLQSGGEFAQGSVSAMALNPDNSWPHIAVFYAAFIVCLLAAARTERHLLLSPYVCFLGAAFIWSKYAFGREDSMHLAFLMMFVFHVMMLWLITSSTLALKVTQALGLAVCFFAWQGMHSKETGEANFIPEPDWFPLTTFKQNRWDVEPRIVKWKHINERVLAPLILPEKMRALIGQRSIDIYPWESLIAAANHLNWQPRPVFQNYVTYTQMLDRKNQRFFEAATAPEFIVWHYHSDADIDDRYAFNSDPLTQHAILRHYSMELCEAQFCLWRKSEQPQLSPPQTHSNLSAQWDQWLPVPDSEADITRAQLTTRHTLLGQLNLAVWKEGGITIDYRLRDGAIKTHTLTIETAASGLWASPYIERFNKTDRSNHNALHNNVQAIRIRTSRPWAFTSDIAVTWQTTSFTENRPW